MKRLLAVFSLGWVLVADAVQVTEQRLELGTLFEHRNMLDSLSADSVTEINNYLAKQEYVERALISKQWLTRLWSLDAPSQTQIEWVTSQLNSEALLTVAYQDHPERQIPVVDIAQLARTTLTMWKINQSVVQLNAEWQNGSFDWKHELSGSDAHTETALIKWIAQFPQEQVDGIHDSFRQDGMAHLGSDNRVLAAMAEKTQSVELATYLLKRAPDEFSYQFVQQVSDKFEQNNAIELLILAARHGRLQSLALMHLTKTYSAESKVQKQLLQFLAHEETQWMTASIVANVGHAAFKRQLKSRYQNRVDPFAVYLTTSLAGAEK